MTSVCCRPLCRITEQGSTFAWVIFSIALLQSAVLALQLSCLKKTTQTAVQVQADSARSQAEHRFNTALSLLEQNDFDAASLPNISGVEIRPIPQPDRHPLLLLETLADEPRAKARQRGLISLRQSVLPFPQQPNWDALREAHYNPGRCAEWKKEDIAPGIMQEGRSMLTCRLVPPLLTQSLFLPGNLFLSESLIISDQHDVHLLLVAAGEMQFAQPLRISDSSEIGLEILGIGTIDLAGVISERSTGVRLLIHSSAGSIRIRTPISGCSLCTSSNGPHCAATLEAGKEIEVQGMPCATLHQIGCRYPRLSRFWPRLVLLDQRAD